MFASLTIEDIRRETADCVSIAFTIPPEWQHAFRFRQGQNITIRTTIGDAEIRRSYSICSSPLDKELRIAIKRVEGGLFSSYANEELRPGAILDVLPPSGEFYTEVDPANRKRYLAFVAGSGITPVLSLIKTTLATEPKSHFTLVYGNRNRGSIIFREELEALKNRYLNQLSLHHILSREELDIPLYQGRIDAPKCEELCGLLVDVASMDEIFLCGPGEMIFMLKDWLEKRGVDSKKVHFELFHPLTAGGPAVPKVQKKEKRDGQVLGDETSQVTVRLDGINHVFELSYDGDAILDAALLQGADLPYACKGGVCCSCKARLIEGKVEMDVNYALEADEIAAGFILTCQSHPRSGKVAIDFDSK
jgi:ring-1,2-phenylacetyl-CoA epoxidase subunit PaaE